jgi:phage shock protein C
MYCGTCGREIPDNFRFCSDCGAPATSGPYTPKQQRPLRRSQTDRKVAGVCAGLAQYMDVDVTLVRIIFLVLLFWPPGVGLILYVICWIVMPQEPLLLPPPAQRAQPTQFGS